MKIIFCLNHFLPARVAGIEIYTYNLARSLQAMGVEVCIVTPHFDKESDEYFYEGLRVRRYKESSKQGRGMITGTAVPGGVPEFLDLVLEERPSVIHFQEVAAGRGMTLHHVRQLASSDAKMIITCHLSTYSCATGNLLFREQVFCDGIIRLHTCTACAYYSKGFHGIRNELLQTASQLLYTAGLNTINWNTRLGTALAYPFLIKKKKKDLLELADSCARVVVLTRWYQQILQRNGLPAAKINYIPQGMHASSINRPIAKTELPLKIVFVGRICEDKGVHLLLKAIATVSKNILTLDIYGPVTEKDYFEACQALSKKMKNVSWRGEIPQQQVNSVLANYDLLCLPSTFSEMSPLVIQEAFAAGIPVLASNVYGNAEQISDGITGWLFPFKDARALAEKIEMLVKDPALIDQAKSHIQPPKTFLEVAKEHLALYEEITDIKLENQPEPVTVARN